MKSVDSNFADRFWVTPAREGGRDRLTVLCKQHWRFDAHSGALTLATPELAALSHDIEYATRPDRPGRSLVQGRDLWPYKERTDLVIQGHLQCAQGRPCTEKSVRLAFQGKEDRALVIGDRYAYRRHGQLRFSSPQPFVQMPLDEFHAYGGIDPTLAPQGIADTPMLMGVPLPEFFPGAYPRNPAGMGYWIHEHNFPDGLRLPNLEDPHYRLRPEDFFRGHPEGWPLAPPPVCWGFRSTLSYPRCLHAGRKPYFLPQDGDSVAWQRLDNALDRPLLKAGPMELGVSSELMQQGARRLSIPIQEGPLEFVMQGICGDEAVRLEIPDQAPALCIRRKGRSLRTRAHRLTVRVHPNQCELFVTWATSVHFDPEEQRGCDGQDSAAWYRSVQEHYEIDYQDRPLPAQCWVCATS